MLQGDVADGGDVEEAGEGVGVLGGEDVEQRHAAVQPGQGALAAHQLPVRGGARGETLISWSQISPRVVVL